MNSFIRVQSLYPEEFSDCLILRYESFIGEIKYDGKGFTKVRRPFFAGGYL